ncbi:MAG: HAD-IA family hydrolase [Opitutales bacterium]|nr:HAD-IA family hydrolase [Opitutales bacterium]
MVGNASNPFFPETVRAVTFDVGGTLVAPHPSVGAIYAEVLSTHGFAADPATVERDFRDAFRHHSETLPTSDRAFWERVFRDACASASIPANFFTAAFEDAFAAFAEGRRWRVTDGAAELLGALKVHGYSLAVLSNSDSRFRTVLGDHGLDEYFDHCFLSGEVGFEKPDIRIFRHTEIALGLAPVQILHVGDSSSADYAGATAAGWHAFLLDPPRTTLHSLLRHLA